MAIEKYEKELSKSVKQNSGGRSVPTKIEAKNKWQRLDLNQRPRVYLRKEGRYPGKVDDYPRHRLLVRRLFMTRS